MIWKKSSSTSEANGAKPAGVAPASPAPQTAPPQQPAGLHKVEFSRTPAPPAAAASPPASNDGLSSDDLRQRAAAAKNISATYGEIVSLLARSKEHRLWTLADVEQAVVPALISGQVSVATAQSKSNGLVTPAGFILWASVSDELDRHLTADPAQITKLKPEDWKSGSHIWIVLAVGDRRVLEGQVQALQQNKWNNRPAKVLVRDASGAAKVTTLASKSPALATSKG